MSNVGKNNATIKQPMISFRPIFLVSGILLTVLSIAMIVPAIMDLSVGNPDWSGFAFSSFVTAFIGVTLALTNRGHTGDLNLKQAFILTTSSWFVLAAFAALPFLFSTLDLNYTDAFFESMSGLTTTGATILVGLDNAPPGILLWRAILQWLGGIGIIVVAIAVLPMLKIGGMQLFRTESSDKSDKILPRAKQISGAIAIIYIILTMICAFFLWLAGMGTFDAICHAMTTIATAGFSTHDSSIGYFDNVMIEVVIAAFMLISAIPYVLYIKLVRGQPASLWNDAQVRWMLSLWAIVLISVTSWLYFNAGYSFADAARYAGFNVTAILTTTGFTSHDYSMWVGFPFTLIFFISIIGGCTGSTTGGMKIFRFQMLYETAKAQLHQLVQPHGVFKPHFNERPAPEGVTSSVMSFFILFAFCFSILAVLLAFTGLDYVTSMSAAASALANLGPGLGDIIGPAGTYEPIPDFAKWVLSVAMLVGRLELFTVLVLISPYFWRD